MRARSRLFAPAKAVGALVATSLCSLSLVAAVAAPAGAAPPPALEGGAIGIFSNTILGFPVNISQPAVVTPLLTLGASAVHTDGTLTAGGQPNHPQVNSYAKLAYFTLPLLGIDLHLLRSDCTADDPATGAPTITGSTTLVGRIEASKFYGVAAPNQTINLGFATIVVNEQVRGLASDGHPGILVNALHLYFGAPGPTYSNAGIILDQSRCEVPPIPIPPGIVPEAPFSAALPLTAAGVGGLGLLAVYSRRRRHRQTV
jgi:hypothetical protein